jgi:hypothetical protein
VLTEAEVERIRQGLREGIVGPVVLTWVERLLEDRDERIERDRAVAVQLLAGVTSRSPPPPGTPASRTGPFSSRRKRTAWT